MRVRFVVGAPEAELLAVSAALSDLGVLSQREGDELHLTSWLQHDDAVAIAAMPGVRDISGEDPNRITRRDAILRWLSGAALVMAVLTLAAANLPAVLGEPADALVTPSSVRPPWPLLPWYAVVDRAPAWFPVALVPMLAITLPFLWPVVGRRFAERRPGIHTLVGVVAIVVVVLLSAWEIVR
ncbi:MAG: hypothetical protein K8T90_20550 [Planctomycetes bacterium]|nr:hypothetical protein [Planctomycetota bacterium]